MADEDLRQLDLLSTFHYAYAAVLGLGAAYMLVLVFAGLTAFARPGLSDPGDAQLAGALSVAALVAGAVGFAMIAALTAATIVAGERLRRGTHRTYCMVVAAVNSLSVPIGTVLGIVTLVILMRPSVADRFAHESDGGGDKPSSNEGLGGVADSGFHRMD